jgi:hypothetical protein
MKLGKTAWLILGIGIFAIAFVLLYMASSRQLSEQEDIKSSLALAQNSLPKLISQREVMVNQLSQQQSQLGQQQSALAEAESLLSKAKAMFPESIESINYGEVLFSIAQKYNLEVNSLKASEPNERKIENIIYTVTTIEIEVRPADPRPTTVEAFVKYIDDAIDNVLSFVDTVVRDGNFTNTTIEVVDMKYLEPPTEENIEATDKPTATIRIVIFSYEGE